MSSRLSCQNRYTEHYVSIIYNSKIQALPEIFKEANFQHFEEQQKKNHPKMRFF